MAQPREPPGWHSLVSLGGLLEKYQLAFFLFSKPLLNISFCKFYIYCLDIVLSIYGVFRRVCTCVYVCVLVSVTPISSIYLCTI